MGLESDFRGSVPVFVEDVRPDRETGSTSFTYIMHLTSTEWNGCPALHVFPNVPNLPTNSVKRRRSSLLSKEHL